MIEEMGLPIILDILNFTLTIKNNWKKIFPILGMFLVVH